MSDEPKTWTGTLSDCPVIDFIGLSTRGVPISDNLISAKSRCPYHKENAELTARVRVLEDHLSYLSYHRDHCGKFLVEYLPEHMRDEVIRSLEEGRIQKIASSATDKSTLHFGEVEHCNKGGEG